MDLGNGIRSGPSLSGRHERGCLDEFRIFEDFGDRTTSRPTGDDGLGDMPHSRWPSAGLRRTSTAGCRAKGVRSAGIQSVPESAVAAPLGYSAPSGSPGRMIANGLFGESCVDRIELPQVQCSLLKDARHGRKNYLQMSLQGGRKGYPVKHAICAFLISGTIGFLTQTAVDGITFATWNIANLHHETGVSLRNRSVAREDADYARLAATAERLDADVVALQEIGSPAALERIFSSANYHLIVSDRYVPGDEARPPKERDIFTALAVSKVTFPELPDVKTVSAFALQHIELTSDRTAESIRPTRAAMQIEFEHEGRKISFLNVHLKSSCHQYSLRDVEDQHFVNKKPFGSRFDCRTLKAQLAILENWIEVKHALGRHVVVAGDFNRRLNRFYRNPTRHEDFWAELNDGTPGGLDLSKGPEDSDSVCWPSHKKRFEEHIDLIVADNALLQSFATVKFEKLGLGHDDAPEYADRNRERLSDHCPVVLRLE